MCISNFYLAICKLFAHASCSENLKPSRLAFTLAEVLIVLGIVGIVVEMTIPDLVRDYNKQLYIAQFRQTYSILTQATAALNSECSGDVTNCIGTYSTTEYDAASALAIANLYKDKLILKKDCTDGSAGCFASGFYGKLNCKSCGNNLDGNTALNGARFQLMNKASVVFFWEGGFLSRHFSVWIDTNGPQKPNKYGQDTFYFIYSKINKNLVPDADTGDCKSGGSGESCAVLLLKTGTMDYW